MRDAGQGVADFTNCFRRVDPAAVYADLQNMSHLAVYSECQEVHHRPDLLAEVLVRRATKWALMVLDTRLSENQSG